MADKVVNIKDIDQTIYYCKKHGEYYSNNCSNCMVDANEPDIRQSAVKEWAEKEADWLKEHTAMDLQGHSYMTISDYKAHIAQLRQEGGK